MEPGAWAALAAVFVLGAMSPGPSLAVVLRNTMSGGRSQGVATGLGHGIGFGIYAFIAVSGIAQLKANASGAAEILEIVGGLFLMVLAVLMFRESSGEDEMGLGGKGMPSARSYDVTNEAIFGKSCKNR